MFPLTPTESLPCFQVMEKKEKAEKERSKKRKAFEQGKMLGISGREMFEFNPETVQADDDEATEEMTYSRVNNDDNDENGQETEDSSQTVNCLTHRIYSTCVHTVQSVKFGCVPIWKN